ncbi:MAG: hypothetical protein V7776_11500 [Halopseudomonas aestusnigri]
MNFDSFDRDKEFESALIRNNSHSCLKSFRLERGTLSITVAPFHDQDDELIATFQDVRLQNFDLFDVEENDGLPWDIMGLNCKDHEEDLSFFCIHCQECEMIFLARWPKVIIPAETRANVISLVPRS